MPPGIRCAVQVVHGHSVCSCPIIKERLVDEKAHILLLSISPTQSLSLPHSLTHSRSLSLSHPACLSACSDLYEGTRAAQATDIAGIKALLQPLEDAGVVLPRSLEQVGAAGVGGWVGGRKRGQEEMREEEKV